MDPQIIAAIITTVGSLVAAYIARPSNAHDTNISPRSKEDRDNGLSDFPTRESYRSEKLSIIQWLTANTLSIPVGVYLAFTISQTFDTSSIYFPIYYVIVGVFQWYVLRELFPNSYFWILITISSGTLSHILIDIVNTLGVLGYFVRGTTEGSVVGFSQWLLIRQYTKNSAWWILVSIISSISGGLAFYMFILTGHSRYPLSAINGFTRGLITVLYLIYLLKPNRIKL